MGQMGTKRATNGLNPHPCASRMVWNNFLFHFVPQNGQFRWLFWALSGPKWLKTGPNWPHFTCLSIPNGPGSLLEEHVFDPFLTHFCSQNGRFSRHFGIFHGPRRVTTGSKWAKTTCLSIQNGPGSILEKHVFDPFLTHFCSQNRPFPRHFGISWPKKRRRGLKMGWKHFSEHPKWSMSIFEKNVFFRPGDPGEPTVGPRRARDGMPSGSTKGRLVPGSRWLVGRI